MPAAISALSSVKTRSTASGTNEAMRSKGAMSSAVRRMVLLMVTGTPSISPRPIWLLTRLVQVDESAMMAMKGKDDMLRMMFDTAREVSPRCSIERKKMNHVESDMKSCIIVHTERRSTGFRLCSRSFGRRFSP